MAKNLGPLVSRVLEQQGRNFTDVVFQQKRPPLDSEWNLVQEINNLKHADALRQTTPSGFLSLSDIKTSPENRAELTSSWVDTIIINNPHAVVNGWVIQVGGGTNQFQPNAQLNIWKELSNNEDEVAIIGNAAPHIGYREDLVFLEVWQKLVLTSDPITKFGFVQSALDNYSNDLIDPAIEIETSKRVQIQYRIRWVQGIDFVSYRNGLGHPACFAHGPLSADLTSYSYRPHPIDPGLWIVGDGSLQSQTDLQTVDGFMYAIPIARVHRRNRLPYTLSNQNGANKSLLSGIASERPDGLYYDEISSADVEDLRHKVSMTGFDFNQLLEENIYNVWNRTLDSELKYSSLDYNLSGNILIQVDGISTTTRSGIDDNGRNPDGVKRVFSDSEDLQKHSLSVNNPQMSGGKVWFAPKGHVVIGCEYELWDENIYYISTIIPFVRVYNEVLDTVTTLSGGTWTGLGEKRTWNYLTGVKNTISYTPTDVTLIQNKKVVFEFKFVVREGGGLTGSKSGFNYNIKNMLLGHNDKDGKPLDFNLYTSKQRNVPLDSYYSTVSAVTKGPRVVGSNTDNAISRSINSFEEATDPANTFKEKYKAATMELKYYVLSTGNTEDFIESILYERNTFGILSVYNASTLQYLTPSIEKQSGGYKISGLVVNTGDILEYTVLCGSYTFDYIPHSRGIRNISKVYNFSDSIQMGDTVGVMNLNTKNILCDGVLATAGFFNGSTYRHIAFINSNMVFIDLVEGLGSAVIKFTLSAPATVSGQILIPFLGYYNPETSDQFYFQYQYIPYAGIAQTRLSVDEIQQVKILKIDDKVMVTTAGTGSESQLVPPELLGMIETLPLNNKILEYNFFGDNVPSILTGGESSIRRIPGRGLVSTTLDETYLREGQVLNLILGDVAKETDTLRGVILASPKISERGMNFTIAFNHLNQWSAIVEGMGELKGELFLMVITTTSTKYNLLESPEDKYLEQKGIYVDDALGYGKEIELRNNLSSIQLSQKLGAKVYGAVDLFPLKYRPLLHSS
jgi:hypothetical protein